MRRADDWPFCHSRQNKIIAVVWSSKKHRLFPTKKAALKTISNWKRWKERHGWRVSRLSTGYAAVSPGNKHYEGCFLHTYDFDSRRRLD
jgi:hypothetical protein